jgi:hypothetical protein
MPTIIKLFKDNQQIAEFESIKATAQFLNIKVQNLSSQFQRNKFIRGDYRFEVIKTEEKYSKNKQFTSVDLRKIKLIYLDIKDGVYNVTCEQLAYLKEFEKSLKTNKDVINFCKKVLGL